MIPFARNKHLGTGDDLRKATTHFLVHTLAKHHGTRGLPSQRSLGLIPRGSQQTSNAMQAAGRCSRHFDTRLALRAVSRGVPDPRYASPHRRRLARLSLSRQCPSKCDTDLVSRRGGQITSRVVCASPRLIRAHKHAYAPRTRLEAVRESLDALYHPRRKS